MHPAQHDPDPAYSCNPTGARENTTSDIRATIEKNLPELEKNCHALAQKCEKKWPECGKEVELCNKENIDRLFKETREKLEVIWKERGKQELEADAEWSL